MVDDQAVSGPTPEFLTRLGGEVRRRRKDADLTVQQLAEASGLSRRMLTLIEQGRANPSLVTVDKIARAFGTDFASLTRESDSEPVVVNAPGAVPGVWSSAAGSRAALQIATHHHPPAELWEWHLEPGDRYDAQPDPAGSEELYFVIDGVLTLQVDGVEPVEIPKGGSARLASDRVYAYVNTGRRTARFIRIVHLG